MDTDQADQVSIKVFDLSGKIIMNRLIDNPPDKLEEQIDLRDFADGIYQIHLKSHNTLIYRILIKQ